jgi:hypothetical protein
MTPTRKVRVEALRQALRAAEEVVAEQDHLLRRLSPWVRRAP